MEIRGDIKPTRHVIKSVNNYSPTVSTQTVDFATCETAYLTLSLVPTTLEITFSGGVTNQIYSLILVQPSSSKDVTFSNLSQDNLKYGPKPDDVTVLYILFDGVNYISVNGGNLFNTFTNVKTNTLQFGNDPKYTKKEFSIGDWNMLNTSSVSITHGLSATEVSTIKEINVVIIDDAATKYRTYHTNGLQDVYADSTSLVLIRLDIGIYDNVGYDATSYNRGFVTVVYTPDE